MSTSDRRACRPEETGSPASSRMSSRPLATRMKIQGSLSLRSSILDLHSERAVLLNLEGKNDTHFSPRRMPIVPTMNGNLTAAGIKAALRVSMSSTLETPQLWIAATSSSGSP